MTKHSDERYPVRCRECGNVLAVREGNLIVSTMRHRNRKKEIHVRLISGQDLTILCDHCGEINKLTGA